MQLRPDKAIAPFGRPIAFLGLVNRSPVNLDDALVGRHDLEDLCWRQRAFGVHVAPPEDRLRAAHEAEPPVLSQHVAKLRGVMVVECIVFSDTDRRSVKIHRGHAPDEFSLPPEGCPCKISEQRETRETALQTQAPTPTNTGSSVRTTSYRLASQQPRLQRSSACITRHCSTG